MRRHVGFDRLWAMQIPVPYSLFLRDDTFGWSCGQCPLGRDGSVITPGQPVEQARLVGSYCGTVLAESGFSAADLCMEVIYHDTPDPAPLITILRQALGTDALMVPVRVPAFYYAGMHIEVDLFAVAGGPTAVQRSPQGVTVTADGMRFLTGSPAIFQNPPLISHWIAPQPSRSLPGHAIVEPDQPEPLVWAMIPDEDLAESHQDNLAIRQAGRWLAVTATAPVTAGLVPQTEAIMDRIAGVLADHGFSFADVVKSTTHYVGAPTAAELHDNMAVRNRRYSDPGPASTGIRVTALNDARARTAITLLLRRRA